MTKAFVGLITLALLCNESVAQVNPADLGIQRAAAKSVPRNAYSPAVTAGETKERRITPQQRVRARGIARGLQREGVPLEQATAQAQMMSGITGAGGMAMSQAAQMRPEGFAKLQEALVLEQLRSRASQAGNLSLPHLPSASQVTREKNTGLLIDDDLRGHRLKIGDSVFGFRDNGFSYSYLRAGNIELYNDNSGTTGSRLYLGSGRYDTYSNPRTGYRNSGYYPNQNQYSRPASPTAADDSSLYDQYFGR